ncbi:hypothetical protein [Pseudomonas lundensis]|uniref:Uncharacterized protein n=1 Tax=Pseudomonas lundensis TaxID=86185 RepID=A0AAX2H5F8_9PSED|nr:hypothetical protein [Pseudomonas lundensis]SOB51089.1 conserved membrane hypothetical protein [Pseudomonas lundensis]
MKFSTYAFLLLLTLCPQFANAESIGSKATAYIQSQTDEERRSGFTEPVLDSLYGCEMTQSIAEGTETGKYNCIGKSNKFNSGVSKIVNLSIWKMLTVITTLAFLILSRWFYIKVFAAASQKMSEKNSALTATLITLLFYAFAFPAFVNEQGIRYNLFTKLAIGTFYKAHSIAEYYLFNDAQQTKIEYPKRFIPAVNSGGPANEYNAISFQLCTSSMSEQEASKKQKIIFNFNESTGEFSAFHQVGSCILDVSFTIDMNTESIAKRYGLPSYVDNSIETMKRIIEEEYIQKAQGIAENVIKAGKPRLGVPDTYTQGQLVCSDEENFNLSGMSPNSIKDYAYDAAKCMHGRVIDDLNRVPGYTEALMPKDRMVRVCSTVDHSAGAETSLDRDANSTTFTSNSTLESTLRACAERACANDSSPKNCADSLNFYNLYFKNRYMTNPNMVTFFAKILNTDFKNTLFSGPGEQLASTIKLDMYQSSSILTSEIKEKEAFTVEYDRIQSNINLQYFINNSLDASQLSPVAKDWDTAFLKAITIGNDGPLSIDRVIDCLQYSSSTSPSGRECGSVFLEIEGFGQNLLAVGMIIKAELRVNDAIRKNTFSRTKEAAGLNASKNVIELASSFFGSFTGKIAILATGITASTSFNEIYNPVGLSVGPEALIALAIIVKVPQMAAFLDTFANSLILGGNALIWSIPVAIALSVMSVIYTSIKSMIGFSITAPTTILQNINGTTVDKHTDIFKFIQELVILFLSITCYAVMLYHSLWYIKALFIYKVIDIEKITGSLNIGYRITGIGDIYSTLMGISIYLCIVLMLCIHIIRRSTQIKEFIGVILYSTERNLPEHAQGIEFSSSKFGKNNI